MNKIISFMLLLALSVIFVGCTDGHKTRSVEEVAPIPSPEPNPDPDPDPEPPGPDPEPEPEPCDLSEFQFDDCFILGVDGIITQLREDFEIGCLDINYLIELVNGDDSVEIGIEEELGFLLIVRSFIVEEEKQYEVLLGLDSDLVELSSGVIDEIDIEALTFSSGACYFEPCGECDGKMTDMTLSYDFNQSCDVDVYDKEWRATNFLSRGRTLEVT